MDGLIEGWMDGWMGGLLAPPRPSPPVMEGGREGFGGLIHGWREGGVDLMGGWVAY